ncbi:hypothetical protein GCM10010112_71330 [Actinoplanes lobatus]|uniref:Uncharacterized protein n=1 Tax=Actinoplanes lobatus TaxID=113568 RepID=A0A7W7HLS0_9ACTN|nr:hypothetical protein [Actinoplanes lobatus]MBB4752888.1 hypothetical protein [Actinoplanes lobatus]GGN88139.1 hypothetical protein GCM10010112_71330 [Actinoplanes lobatus]GIE39496.1 hypothetical protein Alo02nite_23940 [Actinoplanes lobatus]
MSDRTVSEPEASDGPAWRKSLGLSLGEHNGVSGILPLTVVVEEITEWVELASGIDAWKKGANRQSLQLDLDESAGAVGPALSSHIAGRFTVFRAALNRLCTAGSPVLSQSPGTREGAVWTDLLSTGRELLEQLDSDAAVHASWDDLVAAARDRAQARREYRPITELLFDQLRRRGLNPKWTFRELVRIVAFDQVRAGGDDPSLDQGLSRARAVVGTPAPVEPTVVWLGYQGQLHIHLTAGRVSFYSANWAVPNARDGGQDFPHRAELTALIEENPIFRVADLADEESDVDTLVRVDLGDTAPGDPVARAADIVDTILTVSIHYAGGTRLQLAQYGVVRSGRPGAFGLYGAGITADAVQQHGPRIADALARAELPRFLAAAITVQTTADHPFYAVHREAGFADDQRRPAQQPVGTCRMQGVRLSRRRRRPFLRSAGVPAPRSPRVGRRRFRSTAE